MSLTTGAALPHSKFGGRADRPLAVGVDTLDDNGPLGISALCSTCPVQEDSPYCCLCSLCALTRHDLTM